MPLNDMQCRTAKPRDKKYKLSDGEGLYLEVMPSGRRYWWLKYRKLGKEKRITLGVYPIVGLLAARQEKGKIKDALRNGFDPVLVKLEEKHTAAFESNQTFELVAREWYQKQVEAWNPRYAKTVMHRLEKYAFGEIGRYPGYFSDVDPLFGHVDPREKLAVRAVVASGLTMLLFFS